MCMCMSQEVEVQANYDKQTVTDWGQEGAWNSTWRFCLESGICRIQTRNSKCYFGSLWLSATLTGFIRVSKKDPYELRALLNMHSSMFRVAFFRTWSHTYITSSKHFHICEPRILECHWKTNFRFRPFRFWRTVFIVNKTWKIHKMKKKTMKWNLIKVNRMEKAIWTPWTNQPWKCLTYEDTLGKHLRVIIAMHH